ncbi:MAG: phosphatidylserine decarboxylase family protein [Bacteroidota bacterium]
MLTKYGIDNIIIFLIISLILIVIGIYVSKYWISFILISLGVLLTVFTFWFFRDPERNIPQEAKNDASLIISPADGKVVEVKQILENIFIKGPAVQISIFLSPLDVHVNRIPMSGIVRYFRYNPGKYIIANHPKSSELNEQTHIGVENSFGKIFFKQIVGVVARRLVWDIKEGDTVQVGNRFGMMKFGSRMDVFLPLGSDIKVEVGSRVYAAQTILGKIK